jgi:serine phosphatase RsbU (regulator of sigma subunit)
MRAGKPSIEIVHSEEQLTAAAGAGPDGVHALRELERIRKEFQSDPLWQLADREGCWICPYCARPQDDVRVTPALGVSNATIEKAYRHLWSKCPDFRPTSRRLRSPAELQEALRRANQDKVTIPRQTMDRMESQIAHLKGKTEELEENVRKASERQRRLLPASAPEVAGAEIDLIYRPAEEVSGDFYDFVPLDDGRIALLVGDVSGHGIAAGVVMGMAKKVLSLRLQDYQDPIEALARTNADVDKDLGRMSFVTAFVAIYDPAARTLSCARAGHNPPLLYNPIRPNRGFDLNPGGMGLGILDPPSFEPTLERLEIKLEAGDVLLLYTDGLVEARNGEGEQFGVERTIEVLASTYGYPPALVLSTLSGTLDRFTDGRISEDDLTAVCVRFK